MQTDQGLVVPVVRGCDDALASTSSPPRSSGSPRPRAPARSSPRSCAARRSRSRAPASSAASSDPDREPPRGRDPQHRPHRRAPGRARRRDRRPPHRATSPSRSTTASSTARAPPSSACSVIRRLEAARASRIRVYTLLEMWEWYRIGLALGLGIGDRRPARGRCSRRAGRSLVAVGARRRGAGAAVGFAIGGWHEAVAGARRRSARGGRRRRRRRAARSARGGTRAAPRSWSALAALVLAALAFDPGGRLPRGDRAARCSRLRLRRTGPSATPGCAPCPRLSGRAQEADPRRHRRPHAGGASRTRSSAARARAAPASPSTARTAARVSTFPSLTPVCLVVDRDRRPPGRARDPAPRLVPPRRAAARRVRLVVRRDPRGRDARGRSATRSST